MHRGWVRPPHSIETGLHESCGDQAAGAWHGTAQPWLPTWGWVVHDQNLAKPKTVHCTPAEERTSPAVAW